MTLFQSLFKNKSAKGPVLGTTFSGRRARLLMVEPGPDGFSLGPGFVLDFGQATFIGSDGIVTNPDGLALELHSLLEQDSLMGLPAVLSIGSNQITIRRENGVPRMAVNELKTRVSENSINVKFKIREGNPFDATYLGNVGNQSSAVLLISGRRELSMSAQTAAIQAGLNVVGVMVDPVAVYNAIRLTAPDMLAEKRQDAQVIIHIGDNAAFAMTVDDMGPDIVTWAAYGLDNLVQSILQEHGGNLSATEVDEILFGAAAAAGQFGELYHQWAREIVRRTAQTLLVPLLHSGKDLVVLLTGEGAVIQDLEDVFQDIVRDMQKTPNDAGVTSEAHTQVLLFDPIATLGGGETVRTRWSREGAAYAVHLGAACAAIGRRGT